MPATLRLNKWEEKVSREKCIEFNKILIKANKMPLKESELMHHLLKMCLDNVKIDDDGEIYLE